MGAIAVRGKTCGQVEAFLAAGNQVEDTACGNAAQHLGDDVGQQFLCLETAAGPKANRNRRVQVAARYVAYGEGHGEHGQAECQRYAVQPDPDLGERSSQYGTSASAENQPEGSKKLGAIFVHARLRSLFAVIPHFSKPIGTRKPSERYCPPHSTDCLPAAIGQAWQTVAIPPWRGGAVR
ncbi:hypothetical protein D3C78_1373190 [compost metagenome]